MDERRPVVVLDETSTNHREVCFGSFKFLLRCHVFETNIKYGYPHIQPTFMRDRPSWCYVAEVRETCYCVAVNFAHITNGRLELVYTKTGT